MGRVSTVYGYFWLGLGLFLFGASFVHAPTIAITGFFSAFSAGTYFFLSSRSKQGYRLNKWTFGLYCWSFALTIAGLLFQIFAVETSSILGSVLIVLGFGTGIVNSALAIWVYGNTRIVRDYL